MGRSKLGFPPTTYWKNTDCDWEVLFDCKPAHFSAALSDIHMFGALLKMVDVKWDEVWGVGWQQKAADKEHPQKWHRCYSRKLEYFYFGEQIL